MAKAGSSSSSSTHLTAFTCQKCRKSIELPETFTDASGTYEFVHSVLDERRKTLPGGAGHLAESFILLDEERRLDSDRPLGKAHTSASNFTIKRPKAIPGPADSSDQSLAFSVRLFDLLSNTHDIDHPLCQDCLKAFVHTIRQKKEELHQEKERYRRFAEDLEKAAQNELDGEGQSLKELQDELAALEAEEASQLARLVEEEGRLEAAEQDLANLKAQEEELEVQENAFLDQYYTLQEEIASLKRHDFDIQCQIDHETSVLDRLSRANVFNDAFCIGHDGDFATINGLRLGKGLIKSSQRTSIDSRGTSTISVASSLESTLSETTTESRTVEAREINAAWGLACLCLTTLAKVVRPPFTFTKYVPIPRGSFSKMQKNGTEYFELYLNDPDAASGFESLGAQLSRIFPFQSRRFDIAMVYFLQALDQLREWIETHSRQPFRVPHPIVKDQIGKVSIRAQYASDADWTKACRYTLTNLKAMMVHITREAQT